VLTIALVGVSESELWEDGWGGAAKHYQNSFSFRYRRRSFIEWECLSSCRGPRGKGRRLVELNSTSAAWNLQDLVRVEFVKCVGEMGGSSSSGVKRAVGSEGEAGRYLTLTPLLPPDGPSAPYIASGSPEVVILPLCTCTLGRRGCQREPCRLVD
jgi:hypothetical protein